MTRPCKRFILAKGKAVQLSVTSSEGAVHVYRYPGRYPGAQPIDTHNRLLDCTIQLMGLPYFLWVVCLETHQHSWLSPERAGAMLDLVDRRCLRCTRTVSLCRIIAR